jgi:copper chaperone NosL
MTRERRWGRAVAAVLVIALVAIVVTTVRRGGAIPDGPVPVVWNRESCAHCRMAIGEPRFAAQLITRDGAVESFDDVGCLLRYLDERQPAVHRLWFHHPRDDRWLAVDEVGFATGATTPMGWGVIAVERGPDALDLAAARALVARPERGAP